LNRHRLAQKATPALALSVVLLASLTACGGGSSTDTSVTPAAQPIEAAQSTDTPALDSATEAAIAQAEVQPAYHMTPALLDEPSRVDVGGTNASVRQGPQRVAIEPSVAGMGTLRLTREALMQRLADARLRVASASGSTDGAAAPQAQTIVAAVHTPAQIRAAYGLADLPAAGASLTSAQQAALGAGQTIYIIDAYHDATALADLNTFSARFGLPTCTNVPIATTAAMPLATPPAACQFSVVSSTTTSAMTATVPAANSTWLPESKLDVQWAHAIAPLARIVLIEMPNAMSNSILGANALATRMGPGAVSMSFGSSEAGWAPTTEGNFAGAGMTYIAAAGDSGTQVLWPAVSSHVIAVGGTSLNWSGTGTRYEAAWSKSGGGLSAYVALPAWQSGVTAAGGGALVRRAVPDVAFNADPMTGEYVALTLPGAATAWQAFGGTSIAAPQWAGVVAVANALRLSNAKPVLGDFHAMLYQSIAGIPGTYAASFGDVLDGANGSCATCRAGAGFDQATGWGTPNSAQLLQALSGVATSSSGTSSSPTSSTAAPTLAAGSYTAKAGTPFSQALNASAPSGTTLYYALSGAPSGLSVTNAGVLTWAAPVAGSYSFTAKVATPAGKSALATITLTVAAGTTTTTTTTTTTSGGNHAPTLAGANFSATAGHTFATQFVGHDVDGGVLKYTLSGAPSGVMMGSSGYLYWVVPAKGSYSFMVTVHDAQGLIGTATVNLIVN